MKDSAALFGAAELERPRVWEAGPANVVYFARASPERPGESQDRGLVWSADDGRCVLAVADGVGGLPGGDLAAAASLEALMTRLHATGAGSLRSAILDGFEAAHETVVKMAGNGRTTLVAVAVEQGVLRSFHAGDSAAVVVGRGGSLKLQTISHSPVGYGVESGLLDEAEALVHEERHIVSNLVGDEGFRIEIGPNLSLAPFDTVVVASDGLFDNLSLEEITEGVRSGPLEECAERLTRGCADAMARPEDERPGKPDDLTFLLLRRS